MCCIATTSYQLNMTATTTATAVNVLAVALHLREASAILQSNSSNNNINNNNNKTKRKVHFGATVIDPAPSPLDALFNNNNTTDESSSSSSDDDDDDSWKHDLWFSATDLATFRNQARETCRQMRHFTAATTTTTTLHDAQQQQQQPSLAWDPSTRGLEQRSCVERQRRKYVSTRFILQAQAQLDIQNTDTDRARLAALASKITAWATHLAIEEAARDYGRAYDDGDVVQMTTSSSNDNNKNDNDEFTSRRGNNNNNNNKRLRAPLETVPRNVRARTVAV